MVCWVLLGGKSCSLSTSFYLGRSCSSTSRPTLVWPIAFATFTGFAAVSVAGVVRGSDSCGCLGPITVRPWVMLATDVAVMGLMAYARCQSNHGDRIPRRRISSVWVVAVVALIFGGALLGVGHSTIRANGLAQLGGNRVFVEPHDWLKRPWPLIPYIQGAGPLLIGDWTVILYRHGCTPCREALDRIALSTQAHTGLHPGVSMRELDDGGDTSGGRRLRNRLAFVALNKPDPDDMLWPAPPGLNLEVTEGDRWLIEVPVEIHLRTGIVTKISKLK